jgi:hypothetical protein
VECGGVRYVAPTDPDGGGSWLSANEFGVSLCLLNGESKFEPAGSRRSRGLLIRELAWAPCADECALWTKQLDLKQFAPFSLVILVPGRSAILAQWDGRALAVDPAGDALMPSRWSGAPPRSCSSVLVSLQPRRAAGRIFHVHASLRRGNR